MANQIPTNSAVTAGVSSARDRRRRALHLGAASGIVARGISVACTLATVPIALRFLGAEAYGLWMTLTSMTMLLGMLDFGVGLGTRNFLANAFGRNDPASAHRIWLAAFRRLALGGLTVAGAGTAAALSFDWTDIFNVTDPALATQLPAGLVILALGAGLALPLSLAPAVAAALQQPWLPNLGAALAGALLLGLVLLAAQAQAHWLVWVGIMVGLPLAINAGIAIYLQRQLRWTCTGIFSGAAPWPRELGQLSFWFFIPQAGALFAQSAPPMLIALVVGPAPVATFNLLQRIFGLVSQLHWMSLAAWWPAYAEAEAQRDYAWIRSSHRSSWWITVGGFLPAVVIIGVLTPSVIDLWVGPATPAPAASLIWLMATWYILQLLGQPPALLLNGLSRIKAAAVYGTLGHVMSLAGMIWLGRTHGDKGVIAGMMAGYLVIGLPGVIIDSLRQLKKLGRE